MSVERRRHIRVVVPGAYCELVVNGANIGIVNLEDVSDSGVFIAFPRPAIPAQTRVQLRFIEEADPLVLDGVIVQVVQPGGPRVAGYGIELLNPPPNTLERVAAATPPRGMPPSPAAPPGASPSTTTQTRAPAPAPVAFVAVPPTSPGAITAVLLGTNGGHGPAMAQALSLFKVDAAFFAEPRAAVKTLDKSVRVIFAELALLDATGVTVGQLRSAAPRARIIVVVESLPSVDARAHLLRQGADELLLMPYEVFAVLAKMHAVVTRVGAKR